MTPLEFERDPQHWLYRFSPEEWIRAGLAELARAEVAFAERQRAAAIAALKRAAGMALNGALIRRPNPAWGRSYVEHLQAVAVEVDAPASVQEAARTLLEQKTQSGNIVALRTAADQERLLEAARLVMAHAYALVHGAAPAGEPG